ncbi:uncharacterized protein LOC125819190 [Solanum verrucosum]|uniref:uncharacterized protein LOC125819190 n=1 Tax=Solanum verrucosum TaxID=315347 RepID=UPI0020D1E8F6|nr:uncharacterized protein LOC125819190 [Solanum verrucosum]
MRLRLFPLSLTGEQTNWLNEILDDSITTWMELKEAFLERFFPESKELQMKDEISTHKQLPGEAMHDTWWRFSQKLKKCPNHDLTERHLEQAFYRSLNYVTKHVVDAVCGGLFMRKPFSESMQLLDEVSKNNRAWYTRDAEVGELGYTFELSAEQRKREEERDQGMAYMRTQIDLLTKHIIAKSKKVNVVRQQNRYEDQDIDLDEEDNYLGNQGGFRNYNSGNQGYNSGNAGQNYARDGQYDRPANRDQGNWNKDGYRNDRSGVYVPPGNRDWANGSSSGSKLEDMMAKVLQKVESTDVGVKKMRGDFSSMSQLVDSHTTSIKKIEQQLVYAKSKEVTKDSILEAEIIAIKEGLYYCDYNPYLDLYRSSSYDEVDGSPGGSSNDEVLEFSRGAVDLFEDEEEAAIAAVLEKAVREEDEAEQVDDLEDP